MADCGPDHHLAVVPYQEVHPVARMKTQVLADGLGDHHLPPRRQRYLGHAILSPSVLPEMRFLIYGKIIRSGVQATLSTVSDRAGVRAGVQRPLSDRAGVRAERSYPKARPGACAAPMAARGALVMKPRE
jgi:hypothetical protein